MARVAVMIPCYNEHATIGKVVQDLKKVLPHADIYVFDNNSSDNTIQIAQQSGAVVFAVPNKGKGNVVRSMFDTISADIYLIVDGDDTYHAEDAKQLIEPIQQGKADMVVGNRLAHVNKDSLKRLNRFGNILITNAVNYLFHTKHKDILSGYRAFNRKFIQMIPVLTRGFEIELELTLQALIENLVVIEIPISYRNRPENSRSKLRPFYDGYKIMLSAAILLRDCYPLRLYGMISVIFGFMAITSYAVMLCDPIPVVNNFLLIATIFFAIASILSVAVSLLLSAINTRFREMKQIIYRKG
ncbi:MAG: glycosyltransferase [Elusimicrobia bacterium]|nr:glycosyltransferase [Elusimicrobiota bacterium]